MIGSVADGSLFLDVIYPNLMKNKLLLSLRIQRNKLIHTSEQTQIGNHYILVSGLLQESLISSIFIL
ncbi:hypothetical protein DW676_05475 [Phocaeicola vulgatus]|nr:hypothetical protein DW676_05475 [Phocaeicola vulgatus]CUO10308.1 Uncharacterised protein [Bacteroides xylanisolvens]